MDTQEAIKLDFRKTIINDMIVILPSIDMNQGDTFTGFVQLNLEDNEPAFRI